MFYTERLALLKFLKEIFVQNLSKLNLGSKSELHQSSAPGAGGDHGQTADQAPVSMQLLEADYNNSRTKVCPSIETLFSMILCHRRPEAGPVRGSLGS